MADFFRRLSEQVLNRAAVVQPLRASRFALAPEMNLPTLTQLRQRLSAPVHHDDARGAAPAFAPRPLPAALVPPEAPYNTWPIPSLRQLGRVASATGSGISPQRNPPNTPIGDLTTPDGESAETVEGAASSTSENQIISPQTLGSFTAPTTTAAAISESGDAALVDSALGIGNQNAPSAERSIPPVPVPQHPNANVGVGHLSLDTELAVAVEAGNIAPSTPDPVSLGGDLPRVAPDRWFGAQSNPIPQETGVVPIPLPEHALGQSSMAEPTSAPLLSEGDVNAGSAAAYNTSLAPANLPGTPQRAAIQSPSIAVTTDTNRPAALEVKPMLPRHEARVAAPAEAENGAPSTPETVSPGVALPHVVPNRQSGAQINPIPQETGVAPNQPPERAPGQPTMAEPTSVPLPSEGPLTAGPAATDDTPLLAATQLVPITVNTDLNRSAALEVRPMLPKRDLAAALTSAQEKPSAMVDMPRKMAVAVDRQPAEAPAPLVAGVSAETAPTNPILPALTPPVASPNTATNRNGPLGKMLPAEESQLVPTPQVRSENLHEVLAAPVSTPTTSGRGERANIEAVGNASAAAPLVAPLFSVAEDRGKRHQGETGRPLGALPLVHQGNPEPVRTVSVAPQLVPVQVQPVEVRPPAAENRGVRAQSETTPMPLVHQGNPERVHTISAAPQLVPVQVQPEEVRPPTAENQGVRAQSETTPLPPINQGNPEPVPTVGVTPQLVSAQVRPEGVRPAAAEMVGPVVTALSASHPTTSSMPAPAEARLAVSAVHKELPRTLEPGHAVSSANEVGNQRDAVNAVPLLVQPSLAAGSLTPALSSPSPLITTPIAQLARSGELQAASERLQPVAQAHGVPAGEASQPTVSPSSPEAGSAGGGLLRPYTSILAQQAPARQQMQPAAAITVRVTIGRVEVRQAAEPPPPSPRRRTTQPVLSLDAYLTRAQRGQA